MTSSTYPSPSMEDSKTMPHPQSPHRSPSADLPEDLNAVHPSRDEFCAPVPPHPQVPLPSVSPRASVVASTMATSFQERTPSKERLVDFINLTDTNAMQWAMHSDLPVNHVSQDGSSYHLPLQYTAESTAIYDFDQNIFPYNANCNLTYSAPLSSSCPRSYANELNLTGLPTNMPNSYPPAAYQIEPQRPHEAMDLSDQSVNGQLMQLREDYDHYSTAIKQEEHTGYSTSYDSDVTRSSTPSGDPPMPPYNYKTEAAGEEGLVDKEQPYAQLIFRALKQAPQNTMILREIYDWFEKNTEKAADKEKKGWQNSIRHNLSMNGAFEKVDLPGEDAKKGFMWRLTQEALREGGVKSTTRYRSKQPNKRVHRSHHPLPQRQASGAKGGQAARRTARMRRTNRTNEAYRSDPYNISRSVPTAYDSPFATDGQMTYSPHPSYYGCGSETELDYSRNDFGSPLGEPNMDILDNRSYTGTPFSQQSTACGDSAYIELPLNPTDALFVNSPTPTADEPRTPDSQDMGGWGDAVIMANGQQFFDIPYSEYAV